MNPSRAEHASATPDWLRWARRIAAIAQNGLAYATCEFDRERYTELRAIAAEMMALGAGAPMERVLALMESEHGYATPKIDTRGIVIRNNKILLALEAADGGWTPPGGWGDVASSPRENVEREVLEETGLVVRATKLAAVYDRARHPHVPEFPFHIYKMFFLCEVTGGELTTSHETPALDWFAEDALPPLSVSRVLPFQIARMFAHARQPELPTEFD